MKGRGRLAALGAVLVLAAALAAAWLAPLPERLAAPPSLVVRFEDGHPAHVFLSPDDKWRLAVDPARVDPDYVEALIRFEDKRFWWHPGFDPLALVRATAKNLRRGRVVSGGSTITMQLVRVLEPRERTLASKAIELARAVQLELRLSKREILAAYLTYIPFGRNLEGAEAAAWAYFGHGAEHLTPAEIATLLAVPQDPTRRHPGVAREVRLKAARDAIGRKLARLGALRMTDAAGAPLGADVVERAVTSAAVPQRIRAFPRSAPHAAYWLRARLVAGDPGGDGPTLGAPGRDSLDTTLDAGIQRQVEGLVRAARGPIRDLGVKNVAVVVVEHETGLVRALVGGFDYWERVPASQIVSFAVPRSPGSALKPLIYAAALDQGKALPSYLVPDVPRAIGTYQPKNYDGRFQGLVELETALSQSLNVPFVDLLETMGLERFLGILRTGGARSIPDEPGRFGLSVAAGGIELTALELTGLYAALASDGAYRPLHVTKESAASRPRDGLTLMSRGAAHLTRRALRSRDRPDFPRRRDFTRLPAETFWKTGTSFGHRDAWAVGARGRYTAAVWLGNADYGSSHALVGADLAAPLLFDVLEGLGRAGDAPPDHPPEDLVKVHVCAYSGHLAGDACPHKKEELALRASVPTTRCPYHVAVEVDRASGLAVAPLCRAGKDVETQTFMTWPADVKRYLGAAMRGLPEPPRLHPDCRDAASLGELRITSPRGGHVVLLMPGVPADKQEVPFAADAAATAGALTWFVNGRYVGKTVGHERHWWTPVAGRHEITVADERGRLASRTIEVRRAR